MVSVFIFLSLILLVIFLVLLYQPISARITVAKSYTIKIDYFLITVILTPSPNKTNKQKDKNKKRRKPPVSAISKALGALASHSQITLYSFSLLLNAKTPKGAALGTGISNLCFFAAGMLGTVFLKDIYAAPNATEAEHNTFDASIDSRLIYLVYSILILLTTKIKARIA